MAVTDEKELTLVERLERISESMKHPFRGYGKRTGVYYGQIFLEPPFPIRSRRVLPSVEDLQAQQNGEASRYVEARTGGWLSFLHTRSYRAGTLPRGV